jgi:hypothetical protein
MPDTENAKRKRISIWSSVGQTIPDIPLPLDQLIGHIPQTQRATLPGDMEDAYGSEFNDVGPSSSLNLIRLPHGLLHSAGLGLVNDPDALLFIRPRCLTQIVFMCRDVMEHGFVGHIFGQPGTGKSSTALFVATRLAKEKKCSVFWAHLNVGKPDNAWHCICMRPDGTMSTCAGLTDRQIARLLKEFGKSENESSKLHVVMLDGIKFDGDTSEVPARSLFLANQCKRRHNCPWTRYKLNVLCCRDGLL